MFYWALPKFLLLMPSETSPQYGVQHTRTLGAVDDDVGDFLDGGGDNRYQISVRMTELYYEQ